MGKSKELFEKIRNENENNNPDKEIIDYYNNNYVQTVTIGLYI